jgi:dihydroorotate dehydrogenase electron transfer subunit
VTKRGAGAEPDGAPPPGTRQGRRAAPERTTVLSARRAGAFHVLTLVAPAVAEAARPGQFIAVAVGGDTSGTLLRRCMWIGEVKPDYGGTIEVAVAPKGRGSTWLAGRRARDNLDIVGPLGRPFPLPRDPVSCVLIGVGHGTVPLMPLAAALRRRGASVHFLLGGTEPDHIANYRNARRVGDSAVVTPTDELPGALDDVISDGRGEVVYACAPVATSRLLARVAGGRRVPAQMAVETEMACGTGLCAGCVLPVAGRDGRATMARACVDGPVFRGDQVRWEDIGMVPFDVLRVPAAREPAKPGRGQAKGADPVVHFRGGRRSDGR